MDGIGKKILAMAEEKNPKAWAKKDVDERIRMADDMLLDALVRKIRLSITIKSPEQRLFFAVLEGGMRGAWGGNKADVAYIQKHCDTHCGCIGLDADYFRGLFSMMQKISTSEIHAELE